MFNQDGMGWRETRAFAQIGLAAFIFLALWSYAPTDSGFSKSGDSPILNYGGVLGAWLADLLHFLAGYAAWIVPVMLVVAAIYLLVDPMEDSFAHASTRFLGWFLLFGASVAQLAWWQDTNLSSCMQPELDLPCGAGGWLGVWLLPVLFDLFGFLGAQLVVWTGVIVGCSLATGISWLILADMIGGAIWRAGTFYRTHVHKVDTRHQYTHRVNTNVPPQEPKFPEQSVDTDTQTQANGRIDPDMNSDKSILGRIFTRSTTQSPSLPDQSEGQITLPNTDLLMATEQNAEGDAEAHHMQDQLTSLLDEYGAIADVVSHTRGPVITRFEVQPKPGVKASRISGLSTDIARSMRVAHVRVVEVSPGKSTVGVEVPNKQRSTIGLRSLFESQQWHGARSALSLALGVDIEGNPVISPLDDMPHLLVAGTTGSGKSVGINAMLLSLLYKASPQEVRLLLVDPKMLELSVYEGIPHLLTPVITDMKKATAALSWCVVEMERRYRLLTALGVRDIKGYNDQILAAKNGEISLDLAFDNANDPDAATSQNLSPEPLPFIVVVIDEFADMIMTTAKHVEELIIRLAQKARAAGIHLILATQRPSVNVITGLIKANIPTRLAFQVASSVDSRTVLDQHGAESLLGAGDMLYMRPGARNLQRLHGAMAHDEEVHRVVSYYKSVSKPDYLEAVVSPNKDAVQVAMHGGTPKARRALDEDEMYEQALDVVLESGRASASFVQRRLRIGYNRAARLLEIMEEKGIVSSMDSKGSREILARDNKDSSML